MRLSWLPGLALPLLIAAAMLGCGGDDANSNGDAPFLADAKATAVVRQLLAAAPSDRAPGQELALTGVVIPAGEMIAAHTHPGPQLAVIVSGTLTYIVHQGSVEVFRAAGSDHERRELIGPGQSVQLRPGDSLIELPGMVHTGQNATKEPVVIYLSSLFPEGAPAASPAQ